LVYFGFAVPSATCKTKQTLLSPIRSDRVSIAGCGSVFVSPSFGQRVKKSASKKLAASYCREACALRRLKFQRRRLRDEMVPPLVFANEITALSLVFGGLLHVYGRSVWLNSTVSDSPRRISSIASFGYLAPAKIKAFTSRPGSHVQQRIYDFALPIGDEIRTELGLSIV